MHYPLQTVAVPCRPQLQQALPKHPTCGCHTPPSPQPDLFFHILQYSLVILHFPHVSWFCIVVSLVFSTHFHLWICLLAWLLSSFMIPIFILPFLFSLQVCEIHQNTGHSTALQKDKIQLHPPEHRHKPPNQETFHQKAWSNPHLLGEDSINKRNYNLPACRRDLKHSELKNERQRYTQQMKEHAKTHKTKQMRNKKSAWKRIRVMTANMTQKLRSKKWRHR